MQCLPEDDWWPGLAPVATSGCDVVCSDVYVVSLDAVAVDASMHQLTQHRIVSCQSAIAIYKMLHQLSAMSSLEGTYINQNCIRSIASWPMDLHQTL